MKNALVTGASAGIGRAIATALGAAGYHVVVNYRGNAQGAAETVNGIRAGGGEATVLQADISRREEAERLFNTIEEKLGFVTYLVNNAGVTRDALLPFLSDEQWDEVIDTNLRGTYLCSQLA